MTMVVAESTMTIIKVVAITKEEAIVAMMEKEAEVKEKLREVTGSFLIVIITNLVTFEGYQGAGGRGSGHPHLAPEDPQARGSEGGRGDRD